MTCLLLCLPHAYSQYSGGPGGGHAISCLPSMIILPVEMLWMEATCAASIPTITWATATEQNNSHFVIERSSDLVVWEEAGRVAGAGHSQQVTEYAWSDDTPLPFSTVYYRLRQVDLDGREEVLATLPLEACGRTGVELVVLPNPTDGPVEVRWNEQVATAGIAQLHLLDVHGRVLHVARVSTYDARITMDLSSLATGAYTILCIDPFGERMATARLVRR